MNCDQCGRKSSTPACDVCLGYQVWATSSHGDNQPSSELVHRGKLLAELRRHLGELPELYGLLPTFLLPGSRPLDPEGIVGTSSPARPPVNLDVTDLLDTHEKADAEATRTDYDIDRRATQWRDGCGKMTGSPAARRQGILPTLSSWVLLVDENLDGTAGYVPPWVREACCGACFVLFVGQSDIQGCCVGSRRPHPWQGRTVSGECRFLLNHLDWIIEQRWSDELGLDVKTMRDDMRRAIGDRDTEEATLTCLVPGCGWDVMPAERGIYRCAGCGKSWGEVELSKMAERKRPRTIRECAKLFQVGERTLWRYVDTDKVRPLARDSGRDLYDTQQIAALAAKIKLSRAQATQQLTQKTAR